MNGAQFEAAIDEFQVLELPLKISPEAESHLRAAVEEDGILLLGECHGVRENPLAVYTLMRLLGVRRLGLEWPPTMRPMLDDFMSGGGLAYAPIEWSADGRITAGHFAVLRTLQREGLLDALVLFSPFLPYATWSDRDSDMARHLLAGIGEGPALAVAGNLHSALTEHAEGVPMGKHIAREWPASIEIRIEYLRGTYFNFGRKRLGRRFAARSREGEPSLDWVQSRAVLTVPEAHMAAVPAG